jgi:hypothetical protein
VTYSKDDKNKEVEKAPKKVYMIIDNQKHYIDPEMVKKYNLEKAKVSPLTGRKLYVEED